VAAQEIGDRATNSVKIAEKAGSLLEEIVPNITKTADLVQEITAASEEQAAGTGQITGAMSQLDQVTQQSAAGSEQLAATSVQLQTQAEYLQELMGFFTIKQQEGDVEKRSAGSMGTALRKDARATGNTQAGNKAASTPQPIDTDETEYEHFVQEG